MVNCIRCGFDVPEEQSYVSSNDTLCEDCYLERLQRVKACDPWAVHHARCTLQNLNSDAGDTLSTMQRQLYEFIANRGKVDIQEIIDTFGLTVRELENMLAILRHCELIRGCKENGDIYLVPF